MGENRLYKNELVLAGRRVDLGRITVPFLHVMAEHDHIVPANGVAHEGPTTIAVMISFTPKPRRGKEAE